ncbi:hypothetical protein BT63DRAFT_371494 [Microthyrium microscopicum]|uniref:dual-specificity kinase n=1 Tax=Microthyrium microscopicum TaxID=703497 RepID=A0A6A6UD15_9PEZI|nr:hypothetical protein BT63DRAFT_371494 [Microthyrium microscopicum]
MENWSLTAFRITSDSHFQHHRSANPFIRQPPPSSSPVTTPQSYIPNNNGTLRPAGALNAAREKAGQEVQGSNEFLPSVNFDDFHSSLSGINDLSMPASANASNTSVNSTSGRPAPARQSMQPPQPQQPPAKVSRSESLVRRFSNARRPVAQAQTHIRTDSSTMPPPAQPGARGRRQSTLTASLAQSTAGSQAPRPPRKSVGPGFIPQAGAGIRSNSRDSRIPPSQSQPSLIRSNSINRPVGHPASLIPNGIAGSSAAAAAKTARTKSLQPLPRGQSHGNLLFGTNPNSGDMNGANQASPRPRPRPNSPSSGGSNANRRLSTVYVGGLGARTVSPTDARRLRRLSTAAPKGPSIPQLPSASQPDLALPTRNITHSPAALDPKSVTPSSSQRNTPDFTRKAVNSVQSVSSSSSFNSLRLSMNNAQRNSQILSSSRLPTPKPRNTHSSTGFVEEEEVPPVPAIPKAYESPKDQLTNDPSYFARIAVASELDDPGGTPTATRTQPQQPTGAPPPPPTDESNRDSRQFGNQRQRRGMTVGSSQESEKPTQTGPNLNKKNLQPLRLPPLNLLPLSTPTAARIASLPTPSSESDQQAQTPPPKRNAAKTPSTPMTASKATFFARHEDDDYPEFNAFRSSSSHHPIRPDGMDREHPQFGLSAPIPVPGGSRTAASPFSSNSLPKLHDFGPFSTTPVAATPVEGNFPGAFQSQPYLPAADHNQYNGPQPSPKIVTQLATAPNASTRTSSSDEPSTPASTTSLRRKLSLTWKRSSSKASQRAQAEKDREEAKAKQSEMPPPKIPASATWTRTSSDNGSARASFDTKPRKISTTMSQSQHSSQHAPQPSDSSSHKAEPAHAPPPYAGHQRQTPRSSSSSILTPVQRILGAKGSVNMLRSRNLDTNLDKDDLAADKIMEKLASKRKDFEHAAKEVDELRRRAHPKDRVSPSQAIQMVNLNIFERGEIIDYKEVYFCGTRNAKKIIGNADQASTNFGYDDERGDYNIKFGDHLSYRYEVVDLLGKGSFGQVVRCIDHKTGGLVAIKIIRNKKRFHQQALVEVNILQKLREWDPENKHSMINFTQSFYFRGHLCISTELLGINLYEFIKAYEFKGFPIVLIRRFTKQILSSLVLLKSKRVIHCDLKPENILLAHPLHSEIKVIDFGSSCFENEKVYTYIQSRFYRSPEVILGMSYGIPIDMWSLGCILAELLSGYPIFPGENEQEQLACIMEIFGPPEKHLIEKSSRKKLFFDSMGKPRVTVSSKGRRRRPSSKTLQSAIKCDDEAFLDFLSACLRWDPDKRLKPEQAMQHEFITGVKRAPQSSRPMARPPIHTQSAQNSPAKRFNAPNPTPQRAQGSRDVSGARPLPEPPAAGFRVPSNVSASPSKAGAAAGPGRRHSTMNSASVPGTTPGPGNAGKRVYTTGSGIANASAPNVGLAGAIASGRQQQGQRVVSNRAHGGELANAAAAVSLRGTR